MKNNLGKNNKQSPVVTHKPNKDADNGALKRGSKKDPGFHKDREVTYAEKELSHLPPNSRRTKEDSKGGNIGKNNAGGYE
jgi:hypothetical protein